jgi:16S rRNA (guanine527-N7)-methyltransferase
MHSRSMIERLSEIVGQNVPRGTLSKLIAFSELLQIENDQQNLISRASVDQLWERHILDSAQLVRLAPRPDSSWLDIGAGAGLPGIVIAILSEGPVRLVEPRRLRADFLERCVADLDLGSRVTVESSRISAAHGSVDCLTARAVASVDRLFAMAGHLAGANTRWILPKGRSGRKELAEAEVQWQGRFRTEASRTEAEAVIVVAEAVRRRPKGRG